MISIGIAARLFRKNAVGQPFGLARDDVGKQDLEDSRRMFERVAPVSVRRLPEDTRKALEADPLAIDVAVESALQHERADRAVAELTSEELEALRDEAEYVNINWADELEAAASFSILTKLALELGMSKVALARYLVKRKV